jgi:hypothetical protein
MCHKTPFTQNYVGTYLQEKKKKKQQIRKKINGPKVGNAYYLSVHTTNLQHPIHCTCHLPQTLCLGVVVVLPPNDLST